MASREILTPSTDIVSELSVSQKVCSTPRNRCGSRQVVTALSVLCSLPCSGVFIAVVACCRWSPLSPLSEVLSLPAAEVSYRFAITSQKQGLVQRGQLNSLEVFQESFSLVVLLAAYLSKDQSLLCQTVIVGHYPIITGLPPLSQSVDISSKVCHSILRYSLTIVLP